jgi:hypothetical protein
MGIVVQRLRYKICVVKVGITPKGKGSDGLGALMLCNVGFAIIGSYPEFPDNSKEENLPLEGVKQRHKVKLRKEEEPEEGSSPKLPFSSRKTKRGGRSSEEANRLRNRMLRGPAIATPSCWGSQKCHWRQGRGNPRKVSRK